MTAVVVVTVDGSFMYISSYAHQQPSVPIPILKSIGSVTVSFQQTV